MAVSVHTEALDREDVILSREHSPVSFGTAVRDCSRIRKSRGSEPRLFLHGRIVMGACIWPVGQSGYGLRYAS